MAGARFMHDIQFSSHLDLAINDNPQDIPTSFH